MIEQRPPLSALSLALCLALPAAARQEPLPPPPPEAAAPATEPTGPIAPVAPPAPPGGEPTGAPQAIPAPAVPPVPAGPPGAGPDRLDFQLKFKDGSSAAGSAVDLKYVREDSAALSGGVQIRYQDVDLKADQAEIDLETKVVTATGNITLDQGPRRLTGETAVFNLDTKTGKLTNSTGQVAPDYYFVGKEVAKTGDDTYQVTDGIFTSCSQEVPDWSFRLREATVQVDGYARVRSASMRAKKLPVFYTPYILWPVKIGRSSGLLIPNIGYSDRRGASLGLAYFQTLGRSYDTTFHLDTYTEGFLGLGNEFRYHPTAGTKGDLVGYYVRDPELEEWRWKVELNHTTDDLPWGMRGVIQFQDYSDFNFFRDFERDFDRNTLRFIDSRAFVSGNWGPHLLNAQLSSRETFLGFQQTDTIQQRRLPEIEYRLRSTRLARTPFYLEVESSLDYLQISRPKSYDGQYGRVDLFPQVTLPIRTFPWLSLSITGGERLTWYGDSLDATQRELTGDALTRAFPVASAQIVGPSFSRIFDWKVGGFGKFKHLIEPRWTYVYQGDIDDTQQVPLFDEVDTPISTNRGRLALSNRILAKPDTENGAAREVLLFEVARSYSFDALQPLQVAPGDRTVSTTQGPIEALLRFSPTDKISLKLEADYDTLFGGISSTGLTGNYGFGTGNYLGATWFTRTRQDTGESLSNQVRLNGALGIKSWNLRVEGQVNYDFEQKLLQQQTLVVSYAAQCYGLRLELRDFRAGIGPRTRDKDIRLSLSLKNVGTFLDLNSRSSTIEP